MYEQLRDMDGARRLAAEIAAGRVHPQSGVKFLAALSSTLGFPSELGDIDHLAHLLEDVDLLSIPIEELEADIRGAS